MVAKLKPSIAALGDSSTGLVANPGLQFHPSTKPDSLAGSEMTGPSTLGSKHTAPSKMQELCPRVRRYSGTSHILPSHGYTSLSSSAIVYFAIVPYHVHTTIGCGKQGFPSAQPYLSHTPVS